jgi:antitoxin HicB
MKEVMTMEMTYTYPVRLVPDDNGTVLVSFPDFAEAHTFGDTKEEALARAVDALVTVMDAYIKDRRDIPRPSKVTRYAATLPALMTSKVALYEAMRRDHVGKAELARRLNWHLPQVDRLLDVHHASRLDQMEAAFEVLGWRMCLFVEPKGGTRSTPRMMDTVRKSLGSIQRSRERRRRVG